MMKLYAISDLHLHYEENREALSGIPDSRDHWIILAGDVGEQAHDLKFALDILTSRFGKVFWVPGNHELWTMSEDGARGQAKYEELLRLCATYNEGLSRDELKVVTPEDPFTIWPGEGPPCVIAPLFNLYDYSFRPDHIASYKEAFQWALDTSIMCNDEELLHADPHQDKVAWCEERLAISRRRLEEVNKDPATRNHQLVIINHYPLRYEHVRLFRIPRFSLWCGTKKTENWHKDYNARVVVYGHLHIRATDWIEGVRFEEVSLGYPQHWRQGMPIRHYMREILPGPEEPV